MAQFVLNIPNVQAARVVNALCKAGGYTGDPSDQPARQEFARQFIGAFVRRTTLEVERREALQAMAAALPVVPDVDVT